MEPQYRYCGNQKKGRLRHSALNKSPREQGDRVPTLFCDACLDSCGSGKFFLTCQRKKLSWVEGTCPRVCHCPLTKGCWGLAQSWGVLELEDMGPC